MQHLLGNIAACLLIAVVGILAMGCEQFEGQTILSFNDAEAKTTIEVKAQLSGGSNRVHMQVQVAGKLQRLVLCEGVDIHQASLLRYNDWFLVLAGSYVIGGYDAAASRIVNINSASLPFTVHTLSGYIVDQKRLADGDDPLPREFIERRDR